MPLLLLLLLLPLSLLEVAAEVDTVLVTLREPADTRFLIRLSLLFCTVVPVVAAEAVTAFISCLNLFTALDAIFSWILITGVTAARGYGGAKVIYLHLEYNI